MFNTPRIRQVWLPLLLAATLVRCTGVPERARGVPVTVTDPKTPPSSGGETTPSSGGTPTGDTGNSSTSAETAAVRSEPHLPRGIFGTGEPWVFHIRDAGIPPWSGENLTKAIAKYKLGGVGTVAGTGNRPVRVFDEFDYTYYGIAPGAQIGDGTIRDNRDCYGPQQGCYQSGPASKDEAYGRLQSYWNNHLNPPQNALIKATVGHYYFQHYAAEFGAHLVVSEVGEQITSVNAHLAFTRGAARQYGIGWGMDYSAWYGPAMRDYSDKKVWGQYSGPNNGHSISLAKRVYYMSYMSGAQYFLEEAGGVYFFNGERLGSDGLPQLSPFGEMAQEFAQFTATHPDRGDPYAHAAVLLEHKHGMGLGWFQSGKPWDYLATDTAYSWITAVFNALWPSSFLTQPVDNYPEANYMVRGPFGETVDVLLENAALEKLKRYKILFLAGDLTPSRDLLSRLYEFLVAGGTVVIQYPQQSIFGELRGQTYQQNPIGNIATSRAYRYPYSTGSVIYLLDGSAYDELLANLYWEKMPIRVQGNVGVMLNRLERSWVVTLINNTGVSKRPTTAEVNDGGSVSAIIGGLKPIGEAKLWRGSEKPILSNGQLTVKVNSGDVTVVELMDGNP